MSGLSPISAAFLPRERLYLFTFDLFQDGFNVETLLTHIQHSRQINNWSYVTPGAFLLSSDETAWALSESLRHMLNGGRCLVIEVDPRNVGGWLPKQAWEWIHDRSPGNALAELPDLSKTTTKVT